MKNMVAGMINALLARTNSLKAGARSTRTHSSFLSTVLLSHTPPIDLALYGMFCIQSSVYSYAYANNPERARGQAKALRYFRPEGLSTAEVLGSLSFRLRGAGLGFLLWRVDYKGHDSA